MNHVSDHGSVSELVYEQNLNFCIQLDVWVQVPPELQCDGFSNNFKVKIIVYTS